MKEKRENVSRGAKKRRNTARAMRRRRTRETMPRITAPRTCSAVFQWRHQILVCEGGTTVPRRRSATVQGVLQRREAVNPSQPCSDGERSTGSTVQGQVCRQLGTTPIGEGLELVAGVDAVLTNVSEAGDEGVHEGGRQATGQGRFGQDGTADGQIFQGVAAGRYHHVGGFTTHLGAARSTETGMKKA